MVIKQIYSLICVYLIQHTWSKVHETEELMGVLSSMLALPQYLMTAMLVGALTVSTSRGSMAAGISVNITVNMKE